ncbi:hypothetical protein P280DRAFT_144298 [Massarina eburnea CBS 473.64]|uniref:Uncharacterized protein n=1 Tax=Massarina eburnea CBS 473.64 TaxID=1395130 RepID=A0A6A6RP27_9PLEO|nr:hypothetical protein P280DRAFT_144298 [Massarina eburnea CBS 473.64]
MRAAARLLASVRPGRVLEAGTPTGLTGLVTHPSPRSTLLYHYNATLDKLKQAPESSVYRQSAEALTRQRLKVIEEAKPAGWDAWMQKVQAQVADDPDLYESFTTSAGINIVLPSAGEIDLRSPGASWDGEEAPAFPEGIRTAEERRKDVKAMKGDKNYTPQRALSKVNLAKEPPYTVDEISEIENRIGAGLIEEVIQVAEGEHKLADEMAKAKVWEPLEEAAPEGQWSYHERGAAHTSTQKP